MPVRVELSLDGYYSIIWRSLLRRLWNLGQRLVIVIFFLRLILNHHQRSSCNFLRYSLNYLTLFSLQFALSWVFPRVDQTFIFDLQISCNYRNDLCNKFILMFIFHRNASDSQRDYPKLQKVYWMVCLRKHLKRGLI